MGAARVLGIDSLSWVATAPLAPSERLEPCLPAKFPWLLHPWQKNKEGVFLGSQAPRGPRWGESPR